jgi:EAL and modified HD-GYP domain-containing signal transduction protein
MTGSKSSHKSFFLGRQPILDTQQEIMGYELLFRSSEKNLSEFESQNQACTSVIASAMAGFGFREILGDKAGFINITEDVLLSDMVEILPRGQTILELLESVQLGDKVYERCRNLKARGFRIALDDHIYAPEHAALYRLVDIVKIDMLETRPSMLPDIVAALRQYPLQILAERVETLEQFQDCLELGFDLFQGYFFERPAVLKRKGLEPSIVAMLKLLGCLREEAELDEIEDIFHDTPELSYNLLKLVNSVHLGLREKIRSLRHAIMILGLDKLRRWVQLAIFASTDSRGINNPLLEMAAVRGRLMEYLIMKRYELPRGSDLVEAAFMTGILSLVDVLFETSIEEVIRELYLSDEIVTALLDREGELGTLLALAETLELTNFGEVQELVATAGIPKAQLLAAQMDAYNWRASIKAGAD